NPRHFYDTNTLECTHSCSVCRDNVHQDPLLGLDFMVFCDSERTFTLSNERGCLRLGRDEQNASMHWNTRMWHEVLPRIFERMVEGGIVISSKMLASTLSELNVFARV